MTTDVLTQSANLAHPEGLSQLAHQLQDFLLSLPQGIPFQVQCVIRRGDLMVLSQHAPDEQPSEPALFAALEQAIQVLVPGSVETGVGSTPLSPSAQVKLYLRRLGQRQPYAFYKFNLATSDSSDTELADQAVRDSETPELPAGVSPDLDSSLDRQETEIDLDQLLVLDSESGLEARDIARETLESENPVPPIEGVEERGGRSQWILWGAAAVGVSLVSFIGGILMVSRPCFISSCEPFEVAEATSQDANRLLLAAASEQDLRQAQQQLNLASQRLTKIPFWSGQYGAAQAILRNDQTQMSQIDGVLSAESKADEAMHQGRSLPLSVTEWQRVQALWRSAIAQLEAIPPASPLYAFTQKRLPLYRENLLMVEQYLAAEQQAQKKLAAAKSTASIALTRQGIAQSIENWQQVQVTWQVAIDALKQIPNTTTSFSTAQELLADYGTKRAIAGDRVTREQRAQTAYQQSVNLGQKAERFQQQNQWTLAVTNWRSALNQIEQIAENTAFYDPAQKLVPTYRAALQQAEAQLRVVVSQQKLRDDLNRICAGAPRTCTYLVLHNVIRVQFTPAYENALKQAFSAGQSGNYSILGGAVNHVDTLQSALQTISNNAGMPIEVYNASATDLVGSFNPTN